jgi:S1-C subfamily serine protease
MKESKLASVFIFLLALSFIINFIIIPKEFKPPFESVVKVLVNSEYSGWQGSAVFIDDNILLTAGHIVEYAVDINIVAYDGKSYTANEWYLEDSDIGDIGLIIVDTNEIEPKASFDNAKIGEEVWAIGNPFSVYPVLTKGIISATNATDDYAGSKDMLITDCPINPGSSGCPLFDIDGNILGICSWGYNNSQGMSYFCRSEIIKLMLEKYRLLEIIKRIE